MNDKLLRFESSAQHPLYPVQERLCVYPDGQAALWVTAAADPAQRARAGSFLMQLDQPALEAATTLARRLAEMPPDASHSMERGVQVQESVLVESGGRIQMHNLNYRPGERVPEALAAAIALREQLGDALRQSPASVVELAARQEARLGQPELFFICRNPGSDPVEFLLDAPKLAVWRKGPGGWRPAWGPSAEVGMGLVGALGVLVDGLYAPALLAPGKSAQLLQPMETLLAPEAPDETLWAKLEGMIQLSGPGYEDESFPNTPIILEFPLMKS